MSIESDSTAYYYEYAQDGKRAWAITTNLEEAQEDPKHRIAAKIDLIEWFDATGEAIEGIVECKDGLFLWVEDEENQVYTYINANDLNLEIIGNKKELALS
jgi:hypothetical protein